MIGAHSMKREYSSTAKVYSPAEDLFVEIFCEAFGPEKTQNLFIQYPFIDIYGTHRSIDFALENEETRIAIEIDGEQYHNPKLISSDKYKDDLLKQNSMVHQNWRVYRWVYQQLKDNKDRVKDELVTFLGEFPEFKEILLNMPPQKGRIVEYKEHQVSALENLDKMRLAGESIALLYHATGTGKTFTAVSDAKRLGGRTLFLAHTKELIEQAYQSFKTLWPEVSIGFFNGEDKDTTSHVICGSVQSISQNLKAFKEDDFTYLIVDECHHGTATTYQKIMNHFIPHFTLGLTATPDRTDGESVLELFKNIAHKLDIKTAVELGELAAVRCIRVKTNVDISQVRINGIKYNTQDLESTLFVPERNTLLVATWLKFVKDRKTVIFCASVKHAEVIAALFREAGVHAEAVSGSLQQNKRNHILKQYDQGIIKVLCACDLLNEGWDSPSTEVLFMARPTMSKTIYIQQLGRGMRKAEGKSEVLVFDFIDNANLFNAPHSLHRVLNISAYQPGLYALAPNHLMSAESALVFRGDKPTALLDMPLDLADFELVNLFSWQEEVKDMISQLEFVRMVDVQTETIERYLREGKMLADLEVPIGTERKFRYFKEATVKQYAESFGWELITPANMKAKFLEMIETMDMSYSYKPVLLKAMLELANEDGKVPLCHVVDYFVSFYEDRKLRGLVIEKANSLYSREANTDKEVERNILSNPFKRFEDMRFMKRSRDVENIEFNSIIWKKLNQEDKVMITKQCDLKLEAYYTRLK
jgi:superfamily II DNA or RNA helicase